MNPSPGYTNPVYAGNCPDPAVIRFNGVYYAYGTGEAGDGRLFPMLSSTDLVEWRLHGGALPPLDDPTAGQYWAPEVAYDNGTFYMYYAVIAFGTEEHHLRLATAEHPLGPWTDQAINLTPDEIFAIDAHPVQDVDGEWYLYYARDWLTPPFIGTGIAVDRLIGFRRLGGHPARVLRPYAGWQLFELNREEKGGVDWYTVEGPYVLRRSGKYVCFYSGGRWQNPSYGVGYLLSDRPMGDGLDGRSWRDPDCAEGPVVLTTRMAAVLGPGHNTVATAPNNVFPYIVYHGWDLGLTARMLRIDRLRWWGVRPTSDGPSAEPRPAPAPPLFATRWKSEGPGLEPGWTTTGFWERRNGRAVAQGGRCTARLPGEAWKHWLLEVNLRFRAGAGEAGIAIGSGEDGAVLRAVVSAERRALELVWDHAGASVRAAKPLPERFRPEVWHRLLVSRNGGRLRASADGFPEVKLVVDPPQSPEMPQLYAEGAEVEVGACAFTPHFTDAFHGSLALRAREAGWNESEAGNWRVRDGFLRQEKEGPGRRYVVKGDPMPFFEASCDLRLEGATRAGLFLACAGTEAGAAVLVGAGEGGAELCVEGPEGGARRVQPLCGVDPEGLVSLHVEARGGMLSVSVNGAPVFGGEIGEWPAALGLVTEGGRAAFDQISMTWLP